MNVDEVDEVIPICKELDIMFPLEGVINGHFTKKQVCFSYHAIYGEEGCT